MPDEDDMPAVDAASVGVDAPEPETYPLPWTGIPVHKSAIKIVESAFANDEPVFVLRARDIFSAQVIAKYLSLIEEVGPLNLQLQEDVTNVLTAVREWQGAHMGQVRYPD